MLFFPIFLSIWSATDAARILAIVPTASFSHQVFYRPLWKALAARGHDLVLITTDPISDPTITNLREIDVSIAYKSNRTTMDLVQITDRFESYRIMMEIYREQHAAVINHTQVQVLFRNKNEHFDLLMIEYIHPTLFIFKHRFNVPFIGLASFDVPHKGHAYMGNPAHPLLYPSNLLPFEKHMSFNERLVSVLFSMFESVYTDYLMIPRVDKIVEDALGPGLPSVFELGQQVDMIFTNDNPLFHSIRPHSPATISIAGGLHEVNAMPLPQDLQEFLDSSLQNGVIYFSLGTNVKSKDISSKIRTIIIETFRLLRSYKILWKFEDDDLPNKPDNVKILKWLPQQDVLRHKAIKVFVMQGGLQSLDEALYARVPLLVMPFFADQFSNAKHVALKGVGIEVDYRTLTVDTFKSSLLEVITNESYRMKMAEVANVVLDQPMKPLEKAIWWTEYVLRHKDAKHLRGPRLPFWQYYYLDLFAFVGIVLSVFVYVSKKIACGICGFVRGKCYKGRNNANTMENNKRKWE